MINVKNLISLNSVIERLIKMTRQKLPVSGLFGGYMRRMLIWCQFFKCHKLTGACKSVYAHLYLYGRKGVYSPVFLAQHHWPIYQINFVGPRNTSASSEVQHAYTSNYNVKCYRLLAPHWRVPFNLVRPKRCHHTVQLWRTRNVWWQAPTRQKLYGMHGRAPMHGDARQSRLSVVVTQNSPTEGLELPVAIP